MPMGKERKIYTRFGDGGQTTLLSGEVVSKDELRVEAIGTLDELQSSLGVARALVRQETLRSMLFAVQKTLFQAGSELALPRCTLLEQRIAKQDVSAVEAEIDGLTESFGLPPSFVIPGTSAESAALHMSRSVCRRLERLVVRLNLHTNCYQDLIIYFNRLSDLLFVMAWAATVCAAIENVLNGLVSENSRTQRHAI